MAMFQMRRRFDRDALEIRAQADASAWLSDATDPESVVAVYEATMDGFATIVCDDRGLGSLIYRGAFLRHVAVHIRSQQRLPVLSGEARA